MKRPSVKEYYIGIAMAVARRSTCIKRQYGCVIVSNDEIIATGYNGNQRGLENCCDGCRCLRIDAKHNDASGGYADCRSVHAEQNALISASRRDMIGGTMYLVAICDGKLVEDNPGPCPICKRMAHNAGILSVVNGFAGGDGSVCFSVEKL